MHALIYYYGKNRRHYILHSLYFSHGSFFLFASILILGFGFWVLVLVFCFAGELVQFVC